MTIVLTPTRAEAIAEREALASSLAGNFGTDDPDELRGMSLRGELSPQDAARVDRLRVLDYLLEA